MQREELREIILKKAEELFPQVQAIRRHLHANPELSFEEYNTSAYICKILDEKGIKYTGAWAETGIVARLEGKETREVLLRADMDALPILEKNSVSYASLNKGVMHACGHDVHSSILLGALMILNELELPHSIVALFQPGEEKLPGGAQLVLKEGLLKTYPVENALALHVFPSMPAGDVGFRPGAYMASTDELYFTFKGKGGHGAMPQLALNPIHALAKLILALEEIPQRGEEKHLATVLSIGMVEAKGATNVIPPEAQACGTLRTMNEEWRKEVHLKIHEIAERIIEQTGVAIEVEIRHGYPVLVNDDEFTQHCKLLAQELLGKDHVHHLDLRMTAEDFAWIAQEVPSCFYRLGTASPDGGFSSNVHTPDFDIDERALVTGVAMTAWLALHAKGA